MPFNATTGAIEFPNHTTEGNFAAGGFTLEISYQGNTNPSQRIEPAEGDQYDINIHIVTSGCIGNFFLTLPTLTTIVGRDTFVIDALGTDQDLDPTPDVVGRTGNFALCGGSFAAGGVTDITYIVTTRAPIQDAIRVDYTDLSGAGVYLSEQINVRTQLPSTAASGKVAFLRSWIGPLDQITTGRLTMIGDPGNSALDVADVVSIPNPSGWILSKPILSPDGTKIAYIALTDSMFGRSKLFLMNADGSGNNAIFDHDGLPAASPCWSTDGSFLGITVQSGSQPSIYKVDLAGNYRQVLVPQDAASGLSHCAFLQRSVWACLKSTFSNGEVTRTILMGTMDSNSWVPGPEYSLDGLIISTLGSHPRHGGLVLTARIDPNHQGKNVFTNETDDTKDHVFFLDIGTGAVDFGNCSEGCFTGDGSSLVVPQWIGTALKLSVVGLNDTSRVVVTDGFNRQPSASS